MCHTEHYKIDVQEQVQTCLQISNMLYLNLDEIRNLGVKMIFLYAGRSRRHTQSSILLSFMLFSVYPFLDDEQRSYYSSSLNPVIVVVVITLFNFFRQLSQLLLQLEWSKLLLVIFKIVIIVIRDYQDCICWLPKFLLGIVKHMVKIVVSICQNCYQ